MIRLYLDFITSGHGQLEIGATEGLDSAEFTIGKEEPNKLGRDVLFMGSKQTLRIYKNSTALNHFEAFEWILYNYNVVGFNSVIKFNISLSEDINTIGELDLGTTFKTDGYSYVEFNIIQGGKAELFKKRQDVNVNLFGNKDVDGNPVLPLPTYKLFQKALPVIKQSKWTNPTIPVEVVNDNPPPSPDVFNVIRSNTVYEIQDSLSYFETYQVGDASTFGYILAKTNLNNITISFDLDILFKYRPQERNSLTNGKNAEVSLRVRYGNSYETSTLVTVWQGQRLEGTTDQQYQLPKTLSLNIDSLQATDKIWIFFRSTQGNGAVSRTQFNESIITIKAVSTSFPSVFNVVRLYDAMKYVANNISGMPIIADRWDVNGEFYNQYITTASLMRHLTDKPFNITQKIISEGYLPEVNGGIQVNENETVYYGRYQDFYRDEEIAVFLSKPREDFGYPVNDLYHCNQMVVKFENYQSQKENEKDNTNDIVHGELEALYPNPKGQNIKEASIKFIRDPQLIESTRAKALSLSDNTATQDDSKIFIIDAIAQIGLIQSIQTAFLQHSIENGNLVLRNQNEFDWSILGIEVGNPFRILSGANNFPVNYTVVSTNKNAIVLQIPVGFPAVGNTGINTRFRYSATADLINRTNEGFASIQGLNDNTAFGNLMFTTKRIAEKYYAEVNGTICLNTNKIIKVTKYDNNPNVSTVLQGAPGSKQLPVKEGADFFPGTPLLSQKKIETLVSCSMAEFIQLNRDMQYKRGYVTVIRPDGIPVHGYIMNDNTFTAETSGGYDNDILFGTAKLILEEKYMTGYLNILVIEKTIQINGEISPADFKYSVDTNGKLSIFDAVGELLYPPTYFNRVTVNNKGFTNRTELIKTMSAIYNS